MSTIKCHCVVAQIIKFFNVSEVQMHRPCLQSFLQLQKILDSRSLLAHIFKISLIFCEDIIALNICHMGDFT